MRWAKVPEWLLDELVAIPHSERGGSSPGTALAVFAALMVKHADWTTGRARATYAVLGADVGVAWRAAYRAALLLDAVGALTVHRTPSARGGQAANEFTLHLDRRVTGGTPVLTALPSVAEGCVMDGTPVTRESAGQGQPAVSLVAPLYPDSTSFSETPDASRDAGEGDVWDFLATPSQIEPEQLPLYEERSDNVVRWLRDRDRRLSDAVETEVPHVRAASHPPRSGAHVRDDRGTGDADPTACATDDADGRTETGASAR